MDIRSRRWAAMSALAWAVAACSPSTGAEPAIPVAVTEEASIDGIGDRPVERVQLVDDAVWLTLGGRDPGHLRLDPVTAGITGRIDRPLGGHGPFRWDDRLWFVNCHASTGDPSTGDPENGRPIDGLPVLGASDDRDAVYALETAQVIEVDPDSLEPLGYFPAEIDCDFGVELADGVLWGAPQAVDLATGSRVWTVAHPLHLTESDGAIWIFDERVVWRSTPSDGQVDLEALFDHSVSFSPGQSDAVPHRLAGIKVWDRRLWLAGEAHHRPGLAIGIEPTTSNVVEVASRDSFPTLSFTADGHRWEFHDPEIWHLDAAHPGLEGDWRLVDLDNGQMLGSFDFGPFVPAGAGGGNLWLTGPDSVARIPLDDLLALASAASAARAGPSADE